MKAAAEWLFLISAVLLITAECLLALRRRKFRTPRQNIPAFSVIVAAKDEARHLPELLPLLLSQNFPEYEVILLLDRCRDASAEIAQSFAAADSRLTILRVDAVPPGWSPKKYALSQGILRARHEWLAFTDADCRPGPGWLGGFAKLPDAQTQVIAGLSPYEKHPGLLNVFIRFETARTALLMQGAAEWGWPYMALGRNLCYRKSFFTAAGGFGKDQARLSGDDDLLIARNVQGNALRISETNPVTSLPPLRFSDWKKQKIRHLSASSAYPLSKALLPGALGLAQFVFYLSLFVSILTGTFHGLQASLLILRYVGGVLSLKLRNRKMETDLGAFFPLLDFLMVLYQASLFPAGMLLKPEWKDDQKRH